MAYETEVKITVKVSGQKVAQRKVGANVANLESGQALVTAARAAVDSLADELRAAAGV